LPIPNDLALTAKILGVALAVGLDVLAISVGVGVMQIALRDRLRLGLAFASAEIAMQVVGYELGAGAGKVLGQLATYAGLVLLALIGCLMIRNSFRHESKRDLDVTRGAGLLITALSISLDSLGVGIALPAVGIPLLPMLITVSITTTIFTFIGLEFGARLGERYEHGAERAAGVMLTALAVLFAIDQFI